jgi:hypothetical protein
MRLRATAAVAFLLLVGCQAADPRTDPQRGSGAREERTEAAGEIPAPFDGWTVRISLQPDTAGPIVLEARRLRAAPESSARPWLQHDLVFHNRGNRPVTFKDTRTSLFVRRDGRPVLLVSDQGCGYERLAKRVRPGVCLLYLDAFTVRPGSTARRDVTLFKGLRGMDPLTAGTYVWNKVIKFRVGQADAPVRTHTIHLTYEVSTPAA